MYFCPTYIFTFLFFHSFYYYSYFILFYPCLLVMFNYFFIFYISASYFILYILSIIVLLTYRFLSFLYLVSLFFKSWIFFVFNQILLPNVLFHFHHFYFIYLVNDLFIMFLLLYFFKDVLLLFVLLACAELTCGTNVILFTVQSSGSNWSERELSQRDGPEQRSLSSLPSPSVSFSFSVSSLCLSDKTSGLKAWG